MRTVLEDTVIATTIPTGSQGCSCHCGYSAIFGVAVAVVVPCVV